MNTTTTRRLFAYWNNRRGSRRAPERGEIDPGAIRASLADSFVLTFDRAAEHPFRVAGTNICALFCRELKAQSFGAIWDGPSRRVVGEMLACVVEETVPLVAGARASIADNLPVDLEMLLLPLYHQGRSDVRVLGALVPAAVPFWRGVSPVETLTLAAFRRLGARAEIGAPAPLTGAMAAPIRHGLHVIDGGRG